MYVTALEASSTDREILDYQRQRFRPPMRTAIFSQSTKIHEARKHRRQSYQQCIGLTGVSCYLCHYNLSPYLENSENLKEIHFKKFAFSQ